MRRILLALSLAFPASAAALKGDGLKALERDPSPKATERLAALYRRTKDRDQRF